VFDEQWGDGAAWTAPGGSEVDDHLKGSASLTELHVRGGRVATLPERKRRYYTGVHSAVLGPTVRVQRRSTDNCAPSEDNDKDKKITECSPRLCLLPISSRLKISSRLNFSPYLFGSKD
jgi:hypothetical protein